MKKVSTLALALIAMGSLAVPASAQDIMPKASTDGATYTYYLRGASNQTNAFYFSRTPNSSSQGVATNQKASALIVKLVASGNKYNIVATNLLDGNTNVYLGCTGTGNSSAKNAVATSNIVTFYAEDGKTNADWTIAKSEAKDTDKGKMNQYYPYYKLCPGGSSSVNMVGGAENGKILGLWDSDEQGSQWNFIPADVATLSAWADDAKTEIEALTTTASKDDVLAAITAAKAATSDDVDAKATALLSAYTTFFKNVKLQDIGAVVTEKETDYNAHKGQAGYPTEAAFTAYKNKLQSISASSTYDQIAIASSTAMSAITAVNMPTDGKTYVFTNVHKGGTNRYIDYTNDAITLSNRGEADANSLPASAKFVCRVVGDKYVFVNNDGKYLIWKGNSDGGNNKKGYMSSYDADWSTLTIAKSSVWGCLNFGGKRSTDSKNPNSYFIVKTDGTFDQSSFTEYNNDTYSSIFRFEEVTCPTAVTFNTVSDVEDVNNLATFSAPFATVIPEGVKAYYVSTADGSKATMKAIEGEAIPANEGVILTSESGDAVTMLPITTETAAAVTGNQLGNSAGADKTLAEGDNAYILAKGTEGTAFYKGKVGTTLKANKAYLTYAAGGSAIALNFGGNVTGINTAIKADGNDNAPVYDLAGRRVVRTVKGGLYIKGGNKFLAK